MKKNILEYLFITAKCNSDRLAVVERNASISFGDLDRKSRILANEIVRRNNIINRPISVFLPKNINCVISNIAINYSGNAYMNLDVRSPNGRIEGIIQLIQPEFIITDSSYSKILKELDLRNTKVINIDDVNFEEGEPISNDRLERLIDTDPMCIINTSGSTGIPKGVVLNHKSFIDFTENSIEVFNFSDEEIIGSLSPCVFDIYSFELCMLMSKGSTMVLIPEDLSPYPVEILKLIQSQNVTFLFWVPTIMVNIANLNLLNSIKLSSIKTIWFAGEVFPTKQFNYWKKSLSSVTFANLYGPIEITLDCTYFIVDRELKDEEPIPIGKAYRNTDILILDENDQLTTEGELCVRGTSLAMGYYNNPIQTSKSFVQNPLNKSYPETIYRTGDIVTINSLGEIVFKGRKDNLIKHLGYRIDLSEIEHVTISRLGNIKNACSVYNVQKKEIVIFYECDDEIPSLAFRSTLMEIFPKYMIPSKYIRMEKLPMNNNGKIDRLKLTDLIK